MIWSRSCESRCFAIHLILKKSYISPIEAPKKFKYSILNIWILLGSFQCWKSIIQMDCINEHLVLWVASLHPELNWLLSAPLSMGRTLPPHVVVLCVGRHSPWAEDDGDGVVWSQAIKGRKWHIHKDIEAEICDLSSDQVFQSHVKYWPY